MRRPLALLALLLAAAPAARAQTVTARCASVVDARCAALRLDLRAGDAPWALTSLALTLGDGWRFGPAGAGTAAFRGEDDYTFGVPFAGLATVGTPRGATVDFLAALGFAPELAPGNAGWLEFAVDGAGAADVTVRAADPDGGVVAAAPAIADAPAAPATVTPEPATLGLVGAGVAALAAARRRRRPA